MMVATKPCPDLTEMAAFLDGRLEGEDRDRMVRHLNRCPECLELYTDTAGLLDDLEEAEPTGTTPLPPPIAEKTPPSVRVIPRRRPWRSPWSYAAAAVILCVVGAGIWNHLLSFPSPASLTYKSLTANQLGELDEVVLLTSRGPGDEKIDDFGQLEFRYGELLVDQEAVCPLPLPKPGAKETACDRVQRAIGTLIRDNGGSKPEGTATSPEFLLGRWNEATRLALASKQARYFENPDVRRFPAWLLRQESWAWLSRFEKFALPDKVNKALEEAGILLSQDRPDASQLGEQLAAIADAYRPDTPDDTLP